MNDECEFCASAGVPQGMCSRCGDRGRHETMDRGRSHKDMSEILLNLPHWAIVDPDLREGERTLAGGFRFRTRNHRVTEIRAPRVVDPRGFGGAIQRDALLASGERLGVELGPDMWRVDHDCYTLRFPRRLSLALDQAA